MFYFKDDKQISVYFSDGSIASFAATDPQFEQVYENCKKMNWIQVKLLATPIKTVMENIDKIVDNKLEVDGKKMTIPEDNALMKLIEVLRKRGVIEKEITAIKPFLENIVKNPYINAFEEIYDYCKAGDYEITPDGCILAYKRVNENLGSLWDNGATMHKVGEYTEVKDFSTDRNQLCSAGLHFCSKEYLSSYNGPVTIVVKVNPKDIVSIPTDYNYQKGRCKRYLTVEVLKENTFDSSKKLSDYMESNTEILSKGKTVETSSKNRVEQTYDYIQEGKSVEEVADLMKISVETVKRNLRKYKASHKGE